MNYQLHYNRLIERARLRTRPEGYVERHHVVPLCVGGIDDDVNIAFLTASEHFVAHQLLVKIYRGNGGLLYAASMMSNNVKYTNNKKYSWARKCFANSMLGNKRAVGVVIPEWLRERLRKIHAGNKHSLGAVRSLETRRKISEIRKGKYTGENNPNFGKTHSEETRAKMKAAWAKRKERNAK